MATHTVFVRLPAPYTTLCATLPAESSLADIPLPPTLHNHPSTYFRTRSSRIIASSASLESIACNGSHPIDLELGVRVFGGKGGFGSQLRAAGGRMSAGKATNVDACRDLSGRRLSTIKEAQRQAELLESAPELRAQAIAAEKAKLEALERTLGISGPEDAEGLSASKRLEDVDIEEIARKKHRFDDNTFMEESREIKDNVRSAVAAGLLKKKKKAKPADAEKAAADAKKVDTVKKAQKDKAAMPPPPVAKTAAVA